MRKIIIFGVVLVGVIGSNVVSARPLSESLAPPQPTIVCYPTAGGGMICY